MNRSRPNYLAVLLTFARNSAVRDMTFRGNFLIEAVTSVMWTLILLGFYTLIFEFTPEIGRDTGWSKYRYFLFLSTAMLVNSLMQAFVMRNAEEFGELIRTGKLDFALLKPIDTQFLVSLHRVEWSALANAAVALVLMAYSLTRLGEAPGPIQVALYIVYIACGVAIMYSLMICLAATSVWMGRNQSLYNFWFYITTFARYPMEIYDGAGGAAIKWTFTFVIPIMIAINVPARLLARPLSAQNWPLALFALVATAGGLAFSRLVFTRALAGYRSASS